MVIKVNDTTYATRYYYLDEFGKRKRAYKSGFSSYEEAEAYERETTQYYKENELTVSELLNKWLESRTINLSAVTVDKYRVYIRHIERYVGDMPIYKLNYNICQNLINKYADSPATCIEIKKVLSGAIKYARQRELLKSNIIELVELPHYNMRENKPYTLEEKQALKELLTKDNSKLLTPFLLAFYFGATREEVCALQESDIERLGEGQYRININKALVTIKGATYFTAQKTKNRKREFDFPQSVFDELHIFKRANNIESDFLCCNFNGENIQPSTLSNAWKTYLNEKGLRPTTFHKLRASYANDLKRLGVDLDTIYRMLGHSSYEVTAKHYATADEKLIKKAVEKLAKNR